MNSQEVVNHQLKNWDDSTDPAAYLDNFETIVKEASIPSSDWISIVRKQLTGKALLAFQEEAMHFTCIVVVEPRTAPTFDRGRQPETTMERV